MTYKVFRDATTYTPSRWEYRNGTGSLINAYNVDVRSERLLETLSRDETSNFYRTLRGGGLLPMNLYVRTSLKSQFTAGQYQVQDKNDAGSFGTYVSGLPELGNEVATAVPSAIGEAITEEEIQYAVQKAAAKFYTDGFDALTFAAELKKTIAMFTRIVPRLISLIRRTKSGEFAKVLADVDLEVRYGWRTLYYDIQELSELGDRTDSSLFRASATSTTATSGGSTGSLTWQTGVWTLTRAHNVSIKYSGRVVGKASGPAITLNPVLTAWELVRLSFVVDWFIGIGQWLASIQFMIFHPEYVSGGGYRATFTETISGVAVGRNQFNSSGFASFRTDVDLRVRHPVGVSKLPIWKLRLDSWKLLDLVALIIQALKSKFR